MATVKEQCDLLVDILDNRKDEEEWSEFVWYWDKTLQVAKGFVSGHLSPNDDEVKNINSAWEHAEVIENEPVWGDEIE